MYIFLYSVLFLLISSCSSSSYDRSLDNPIITGLKSNQKIFNKKIEKSQYKHNLIYIDTRQYKKNFDSISKSYYSAKDFGMNLEKGLLFIPSMKNTSKFTRISKIYHNKFVGERYSYNDGPFIIGVENKNITKFIVSLTGMNDDCISRLFQDLEQAVNIEILDKKINEKNS